MTTPRLLLFDLMGTLLTYNESDPPYWHRFGQIVELQGLMPATDFIAKFVQWREWRQDNSSTREITLKQGLVEIVPHIPVRERVITELVQDYMREYMKRSDPCDGVKEMLQAWCGLVPLGVVSNFFVAGLPQELLRYHQLLHYFDFVIDSAQIGWRKPAPEIFREALKRAGVRKNDKGQVMFIGDEQAADIDGPSQEGLRALHYTCGETPESETHVIRHWDEFRPSAAQQAHRADG